MKKHLIFCVSLAIFFACSKNSSSKNDQTDSLAVESGFVEYNNPPADGFDQEGSDLLATLIADKSMQAMGGRESWDSTRYISWNFFGKRHHLWDKKTGNIRIEVSSNNLRILMNIYTKQGKVQQNGNEITDSLASFLRQGYEWWVNDSYWLVMPFKLKDSGVTLKYLREDTTSAGKPADVLSMSFKDVGITPENVYEVWVHTDSKLVVQWAYYLDSATLEPHFITPWTDYRQYGEILLAGNRGDHELTNIQVFEKISEDIFSSFDADIALIQ